MSRTSTPSRIRHYQSFASPEKFPSFTLKEATLAKFVLAAEFDNKVGSIIRHQIPRKIPGFKENLANLGELLIPSNSEHFQNEDFAIVILYKDPKGKYQLLPDENSEFIDDETLGFQHMRLNDINTIFENKNHDDDVLFFYTVTKKIEDSNDERGAKIRSISVGTPLRNFIVFKHLITITVQNYIIDGQLSHLLSLFNTINSIDISLWRRFCQESSSLQNLLTLNLELNNKFIFKRLKKLLVTGSQPEGLRYKSGTLSYYSTYTPQDPKDEIMNKIPLHFPLFTPPSVIPSELNLTSKILKFLHHLSIKLNSTNYKNFNIMIYSNLSTTNELCQFILSLSNYFNGFNNSYFHNDKILYFPLIDLYSLDTLLKYNQQYNNTKIIGTNNLIMKDRTDFYDFWYDLSTEELIINKEKLEIFDVTISKTQDFTDLCSILIKQQHDSTTMMSSFQKFVLFEVLKVLKRDDTESEDNLKDYFLSRNKNLIFFSWMFEFKIIRLIDTLNQFYKQISLIDEIETSSIPSSTNDINSSSKFIEKISIPIITNCIDFMISFLVGNLQGHLEIFIHIVELFPIKVTSMNDLIYEGDEGDDDDEGVVVNGGNDGYRLGHEGFNGLFKPIFIKDEELQEKVIRLYRILNNSEFSAIIDRRLNYFLIIALEEFASTWKLTI